MRTFPARLGYVDTALGQLHYAEAGSGAPVILLHQTPRSLDEYREVLPLLAQTHRVIAMDMYGFGMSAKPDSAEQTIEQYASGVLALADALDLSTFALVGHHTGAFVATEVAASAPDRVAGVTLSAGLFGDAQWREISVTQMRDGGIDEHGMDVAVDVAVAQEDGGHLTQLWVKRATVYPKSRTDILNRYLRDALAPLVDPAEGHFACARYHMEDRVGLVTAPLLLLAPTDDPTTYPGVNAFSRAFPNAASVVVVEIAGGMIPLMEQKPAEVTAAIQEHLSRIGW